VGVSKDLQDQPVISRMVAYYGVTVNIVAAQIDTNVSEYGWLELELTGTVTQVESALSYLDELNLEVWHKAIPEEDGW
jgi:ABC-type methionine transport system ATPase subunit